MCQTGKLLLRGVAQIMLMSAGSVTAQPAAACLGETNNWWSEWPLLAREGQTVTGRVPLGPDPHLALGQ